MRQNNIIVSSVPHLLLLQQLILLLQCAASEDVLVINSLTLYLNISRLTQQLQCCTATGSIEAWVTCGCGMALLELDLSLHAKNPLGFNQLLEVRRWFLGVL